MPDKTKKRGQDNTRFLMITGAAFLLNLGLFIILFVFTPLAAGLIAGYLLRSKWDGWISGMLGSTIAFAALFLATEAILGFSGDPLIVVSAVILMGGLGALGGLVGGFFASLND
jgi:hypothetical protein